MGWSASKFQGSSACLRVTLWKGKRGRLGLREGGLPIPDLTLFKPGQGAPAPSTFGLSSVVGCPAFWSVAPECSGAEGTGFPRFFLASVARLEGPAACSRVISGKGQRHRLGLSSGHFHCSLGRVSGARLSDFPPLTGHLRPPVLLRSGALVGPGLLALARGQAGLLGSSGLCCWHPLRRSLGQG